MKPTVQIIVAGNDRTADITARAMILEWSDSVDEQADALTISVADTGGTLGIPILGAKIELSAGYDGALERVGSFTVETTELEGPPDRLTVTASAAPIAAAGSIAGRNSQSWEDTTLGEIAQTIAGRLSVTAAVDPQLAAVAIVNEQQTDESDTNFLLRLVRREGGFLKFTDGRMVIALEGAGIGTSGAALTTLLFKGDITSWRVQAGGKANAIKKVKVRHHDYETGETKEVEAEVAEAGSLKEADNSTWLASSESTFTPPTVAASEPEAQAQAKTLTKRIKRATRQLELSLPGRLDIIAGGKVSLSGVRPGVDGEWVVKSIRHRIDAGGWSMQIGGEGAA